MGSISVTKTLPGSPATLFDVITRPATWEHWFTIHKEFVGAVPEQLVTGEQLEAKVSMLGMSGEISWTVEEFEPAHRVRLTGRALAGVTCEFTYGLRQAGEDAEITVDGDFGGPLITGILARTLEKHGLQQLDRSLDQLAAYAADK
ncbi:type II toxin-antitoxin system Rv0910 family toxin [Nocardia thailandica]